MTGPAAATGPAEVLGPLTELARLRGRPVLLVQAALTDDTLPVLHECVRAVAGVGHLDLVLGTTGGTVTTVRRFAVQLREAVGGLSVLVPYRAKSAGTLLCLAADDLVLGSLAELGPIDSVVSSAGPPPPDAPGLISAADLRAFRAMATDWFGVDRDEDRLQVLALLAQRIFPTALADFYRFDALIRELAGELLTYQFPGPDNAERRDRIVTTLVDGYHTHDYPILRRDVQRLGLRAVDAAPAEEDLFWALYRGLRELLAEGRVGGGGQGTGGEQTTAVIATDGVYARHVLRGVHGTAAGAVVDAGWELTRRTG